MKAFCASICFGLPGRGVTCGTSTAGIEQPGVGAGGCPARICPSLASVSSHSAELCEPRQYWKYVPAASAFAASSTTALGGMSSAYSFTSTGFEAPALALLWCTIVKSATGAPSTEFAPMT